MCYLDRRKLNTWPERLIYSLIFLQYGILVNILTGSIRYLPFSRKCRCERVDLIRHGKTEAIERKEFMSDTSGNARLSAEGKDELSTTAGLIAENIPDAILVGPLQRTKDTLSILEKSVGHEMKAEECRYLRGINNSRWAGKTFEMLDTDNLLLFLQRECSHNIFARTEDGDSWGDVIFRCIRILKHLNRKYRGKKVLIISQGSIVQGMKIVLHLSSEPWEGYSAEKMFSLTQKGTSYGYGEMVSIIS